MTEAAPGAAPQRRLGLPLALIATLLTLVAGFAANIIWQNYRTGAEEAVLAERLVFDKINTDVALQQKILIAPVRVAISSLAQVPLVGRIDAGSIARSFRPVLDAYPQLAAIRIGFADGTMSEVSREAMPPMSGDPRPTPWYIAATATPGTTVETKPYRLANGQPGISIARTISGAEGVMTADIELKQFSLPLESLSTGPDAQMFLFTADERLFANAEFDKVVKPAADANPTELELNAVDTLTHPAAREVIAAFRAGGPFTARTIVVAEKPYTAAVTPLVPAAGTANTPPIYFAFARPKHAVAGAFMSNARTEVVVALVVMLLGIPLIALFAYGLAKR